jgi:hypothetical protein
MDTNINETDVLGDQTFFMEIKFKQKSYSFLNMFKTHRFLDKKKIFFVICKL